MPTRRPTQRGRSSGQRCKNLYRLIRARLGEEISDREVARRWGMEWKSFVALKHGRRQMPRVEALEDLAAVLDLDPAFVIQAARGIPADQVIALVAREHRWRALLERVTDAIFTVDAHGRVQDVNGRFALLVGRPVPDLLGRPLLDLLASDSAPRILALLAEVARDGEARTADVAFRDARGGADRVVDLETVRIADDSGASIGAQLLARDVTEERRLVRELATERQLLQTLFDCIPAACILFDRDGVIRAANPLVESVCSLTSRELVGRNAFDVFGNPGPTGCPVTRAFLTGNIEQQVSCVEGRGGQSVYVHRTAGPILEAGVVDRVIEILVDVTAQVRAGDIRFLSLWDPLGTTRSEAAERRALPRAATSFSVSYSHRDRIGGATITSLGAGGVFLQVQDDRATVGDEIELEWQLPREDASVRAKGVVVWTRPASAKRPAGIGIKFVGVSPEFAPVVLKRSS